MPRLLCDSIVTIPLQQTSFACGFPGVTTPTHNWPTTTLLAHPRHRGGPVHLRINHSGPLNDVCDIMGTHIHKISTSIHIAVATKGRSWMSLNTFNFQLMLPSYSSSGPSSPSHHPFSSDTTRLGGASLERLVLLLFRYHEVKVPSIRKEWQRYPEYQQ